MSLGRLLYFSARSFAQLWSSWGGLLGLLLLVAYFLTVVVVSVVYPQADWDMVAYVASAMDDGSRSAAELHEAAWNAVRERVSEGEFLMLTADRPYRVRQYADPQAFATMLGFYKVKLLYVVLTEWLSQWMQPVDALRLISTVSAGVTGAVLVAWAARERFLDYAPFILAVVILSGVPHEARVVIPDMLSAAFFVLGTWLYLRRLDLACAVALFLAFLARPDTLAFLGVFAVAAVMTRQGYIMAIATFLAALVAYFPITQAAGHPGWWIQMWFTNIEYVPTLEGFNPDFSILVYLKMLVRVLVRSLVENTWLVLFIMELIILGRMVLGRVSMRDRELVLVCALAAATVAKYFVAPFHGDRYYMAQLLSLGMVLIGIWSRETRKSEQPS
ncbi:hypothetical protein [Chelativorans sp. YIM 93263]|uniref:hypothetical protein n=1 Tax=Chelativorans sp. YIM 93263 TaxID=2906648 RepID=UPI0023786EB2|nr:hypothetical protein [Chelativorans sp. YIM 93263]